MYCGSGFPVSEEASEEPAEKSGGWGAVYRHLVLSSVINKSDFLKYVYVGPSSEDLKSYQNKKSYTRSQVSLGTHTPGLSSVVGSAASESIQLEQDKGAIHSRPASQYPPLS